MPTPRAADGACRTGHFAGAAGFVSRRRRDSASAVCSESSAAERRSERATPKGDGAGSTAGSQPAAEVSDQLGLGSESGPVSEPMERSESDRIIALPVVSIGAGGVAKWSRFGKRAGLTAKSVSWPDEVSRP